MLIKEEYRIIYLIDSPPGSGKSSWAIQEMNAHPERRYIYCTPFLDEISRIIEACPDCRFYQPEATWNTTVFSSFQHLLEQNVSIAVSHVTFFSLSCEDVALIQSCDYILIVDEVPSLVMDYNKLRKLNNEPYYQVKKADICFLLSHNSISIDEKNGQVKWVDGQADSGHYFYVNKLATTGNLYDVSNSCFFHVFSHEILQAFQDAYIMSYYYDGSTLPSYLSKFNITYEKKSVRKDSNGWYTLCDYSSTSDAEFKQMCKELIHIWNPTTMNREYIMKNDLSKSWWSKNGKNNHFKHMGYNVSCFLKACRIKVTHMIPDADEPKNFFKYNTPFMWTIHKEFENSVDTKGFKRGKVLSKTLKKELKNAGLDEKEIEARWTCFVPCNARATNKYKTRCALAYLMNFCVNPLLYQLFNKWGVPFDRDAYALANLLQWIFRSRIRDGQPIEIYIPSKRMRNLLINWMNGKTI